MTLDEPVAARGFQYKHGDRPLDGYTIQRAAGRGGFGEVYYAVSDSGREVALKLVHTYEQIELRGISQCMNLKSPHLVTIFDVKYGDDGRPWVIMEFVSGPSLRELLDASPSGLGVAKAAFFLREIGKGLTYLHDCGIVHRDLKPGNIFYENGMVKIGDYGLSKTMSLTRHSGQTVAVGTLHYMAPEIGDGRYDRSIDIYAMGAMLFEMLTGQVPFFGASPAEVLMKHLSADVDLSGVEEPLKSVIAKAMRKNPAERYQSVQEMVEAVYGSEHIRNSVTQFSPESLTMVAGRVARNIGSGGAGPTMPPPRPRRERVAGAGDPWVAWVERVEDRLHDTSQRIKEAGDRFGDRFKRHKRWGWENAGYAAAAVNVPRGGRDLMPLPARLFFVLTVALVGGFIVAANSNSRDGEKGPFVALSIIGAVIGAKLGWRFIAPGLAGESHWFKRFAIGAPSGFGALILSLPAWADSGRWMNANMLATFPALLLLHWEERLSENRKERFSVGHLFTAGILGVVLAGMCDADPLMVGTALAGASLAASLCARRVIWAGAAPVNAAPAGNGGPQPAVAPNAPRTYGEWTAQNAVPPPLPPIPPAPPIPPRMRRGGPMRFAMGIVAMALFLPMFLVVMKMSARGGHLFFPWVLFFPLAVMGMVFHFTRGGSMSSFSAFPSAPYPAPPMTVSGVASGFARGLLTLTGSALLMFALLLTLAVTTNLPGLFASGVLDARMPHDLEYALGPHATRLLREIGTAGAFVTASIAMALLLMLRRVGGGLHVFRAVLGTIALFAATAMFGGALPDWADFTLASTPGDTVDWYLGHIRTDHAAAAAVVGAIGFAIMCWPRKNPLLYSAAPAVAPTKDGVAL